MRQSNDIFIPIPTKRNTHCVVKINSDNVTNKVRKSKWTYPVTIGIGTFTLKLSNAFGQITNNYSAGDEVKFYADNTDGTTLQFSGRIDYVKDNISDQGQYLEIEGRHKSYLLTEFLVCHTATDTPTSTILKAIIDKLPASYGFTYSNVLTTTDQMSVNWNYKPFWQCVKELCDFAEHDCYPDNDLDFHYFPENSILNTQDAIVEGQTLINIKYWGTNDFIEKTRVTVIGKDKENLPIVYTAISPDEGDDIREVFVRDTTKDTYEKVKSLAEAKLDVLTNIVPQSNIVSYGLEYVKPGDNIWIIVPRQKIAGQYKILELNHTFGSEIGGWRTESITEEETLGIANAIQLVNNKASNVTDSDNLNKLNYSFNLDFENDSGVHSNTVITDGVLKTDGSATGTWISQTRTLTNNATLYELRVKGETLPGVKYYVTTDNGNTWQNVNSLKTLYSFAPPGKNIRIKIELNSADTQIYSMALLYS